MDDNFDDIALQVDQIYQENFDDNNEVTEEIHYDNNVL